MQDGSMRLYNERKQRLSTIISDTIDISENLDLTDAVNNLSILKNKLDSSVFRVMVVGTFKNGKSTFINAMLGRYVLPSYATPATAIISEVKYGTQKRAVLYFANPLPEKLHSSIPSDIKSYINRHNGRNIPPMEIPYDSLEDYATIPMEVDIPEELFVASPYSKIELFWPLEVLKQGVEIIDSPGLNEATTRTKETMSYLPKADAILFVLTAEHLCSQDEMESLDCEFSSFKDSMFFVVNRFDCIQLRERDRIVKYATTKLSEHASRKIYFVSAKQALEAKENNNNELLNESHFADFEKDLVSFLINERGKIKFLQPLKAVKDFIDNKARKAIESKRSMLDTDLQELEERCKQVEPELDNAREKKQNVALMFENQRLKSRDRLTKAVNEACNQLSDNISVWVNGYQPERKDYKEIGEEISRFVNKKNTEFFSSWNENSFKPLIAEQINQIASGCDSYLSNFYRSMDQINAKITGNNSSSNISNISGWERVCGAASVGNFSFDPSSIVASSGMGDIGADIIKAIGAPILLRLIGLINPVTFWGAIGVSVLGLLKSILGNNSNNAPGAEEKIKQAVIRSAKDSILRETDSIARTASEEAIKCIDEQFINPTLQSLDSEINEIKERIDSVIAEKRRGEENVARKRQILDQYEEKLKSLSQELDSLSNELL